MLSLQAATCFEVWEDPEFESDFAGLLVRARSCTKRQSTPELRGILEAFPEFLWVYSFSMGYCAVWVIEPRLC